MNPTKPENRNQSLPGLDLKFETNIRTLRQFESLNTLNSRMRRARDIDECYRIAVECIDYDQYSKVILFIVKEDSGFSEEGSFDEGKGASPTGVELGNSLGNNCDVVSPGISIEPAYLSVNGRVFTLKEFLEVRDNEGFMKEMYHVVKETFHPLDRVMCGEELVIRKEDLHEFDTRTMCRTFFWLLNVTEEVGLFPIMAKIDRGGANRIGNGSEGNGNGEEDEEPDVEWDGTRDYFGVLMVEKNESLMDEDDRDYLREYANILGLALENSHLLSNLERSIDGLQEEKDFRDEILMRLSHEINTPITSIMLMNDHIIGVVKNIIAREEMGSGDFREKLEEILDSTERIISSNSRLEVLSKKLYNSLLVQNKQMEIVRKEVEVNDLVESLLLYMKYYILANQAVVRNHLFEAELPVIRTDPDALMVVLEIVVENAIHYMPRGDDNALVRNPEVDILGRVENGKLVIAVKDNGIGLTEADQDRIFKRLYRITKLEHHREKPGLGLPTARDILDLLGGTIRPKSEPGKGSVFEIHLPLKAPDSDLMIGPIMRDRWLNYPSRDKNGQE